MDCDSAMLLLANRDGRTLTGQESARLSAHLQECESCREVDGDGDTDWVWVAKVPEEALDDPERLALPTVDPAMFDFQGSIARGGMGRIMRAHDRRLGRTVAVKEVLAQPYRARFEREALITARLQHPAIVPIYEAGVWPDGSAFYTMRLVSGVTLRDAIEGAESLEERLGLAGHVVAVTDALAFAHSKQIIHRDLKPLNILVGEFGETVVIDWGLARVVGEDPPDLAASNAEAPGNAPSDPTEVDSDADTNRNLHEGLTHTGAVLGTPGFMAPEQAAGKLADERTDVYALGAILYTMLVGHAPYKDTHRGVIAGVLTDAVLRQAPTPVLELEPRAPADLVAITERAMAREPEERYRDAREMATELHQFQAGQLIASREYSAREILLRWVARHRAAVTVAAVAALALVVVGTLAVTNIAASRDGERRARVVAERALTDVEARNADLIFRQAAASLESDPTTTVAWLRQYPASGRHARGAALMVADAVERGVSLHVLRAPSSETKQLRFIPQTSLLVAASEDNTARAWDLDSLEMRDLESFVREEVFYDPTTERFLSPAENVPGVLFESARGAAERGAKPLAKAKNAYFEFFYDEVARRAAFALADDGVGVWDAASGETRTLAIRGTPLALFDAGELVLVEDFDGANAALVRASDDEVLHTFSLGPIAVRFAPPHGGFSSQNGAFAGSPLSRTDNTGRGLHLWRRGDAAATVFRERGRVAAMAFEPSGKEIVASFKNGEVLVIDVASATVRCKWRTREAAVAVAIEGVGERLVATGFKSGRVELRTACGSLERVLHGHRAAVTAVAISADGQLVASAGADEQVRVHRRHTGSPLLVTEKRTLTGCEELLGVHEKGDYLWSYCLDPEPSKWHVENRRDGSKYVLDMSVSGAVSANGSTMMAGKTDQKSVVFRRGETFSLPFKVGMGSGLSPDGKTLYHPAKTAIEVWDLDKREIVRTIALASKIALPSPDESTLLVDTAKGIGIVKSDGTLIDSHSGHLYWPRGHWSPTSRKVVTQSAARGLLIYDLDSGWTRLSTDGLIETFELDATGAFVAAAAEDGLSVWHLESGARLRIVGADRPDLVEEIVWSEGQIRWLHPNGEYKTTIPRFMTDAPAQATTAIIADGETRSLTR